LDPWKVGQQLRKTSAPENWNHFILIISARNEHLVDGDWNMNGL